VDMGVPPFLVASSVKLVMAQRLLRKVCPMCKKEIKPDPEMLEIIGMTPEDAEEVQFFKGDGCSHCNGTGYKGRIAVFEVLPITVPVEKLIIDGASALELEEQAAKQGMRTLRQEAVRYLIEGITSLEQVITETAAH